MKTPLFYKLDPLRCSLYQIETIILKDKETGKKVIQKKTHHPSSLNHLKTMALIWEMLNSKQGEAHLPIFKTPKLLKREEHLLEFEFIEGTPLRKLLYNFWQQGKKEDFIKGLDLFTLYFRNTFSTSISPFDHTQMSHLLYSGITFESLTKEFSTFYELPFIDYIFDNIICSGTNVAPEFYSIDLEWGLFPPTYEAVKIPFEFILYRSLLTNFYEKYSPSIENFMSREELSTHFPLTKDQIAIFHRMEENFQKHVFSEFLLLEEYKKRALPLETLLEDFKKLTESHQLLQLQYNDLGTKHYKLLKYLSPILNVRKALQKVFFKARS